MTTPQSHLKKGIKKAYIKGHSILAQGNQDTDKSSLQRAAIEWDPPVKTTLTISALWGQTNSTQLRNFTKTSRKAELWASTIITNFHVSKHII